MSPSLFMVLANYMFQLVATVNPESENKKADPLLHHPRCWELDWEKLEREGEGEGEGGRGSCSSSTLEKKGDKQLDQMEKAQMAMEQKWLLRYSREMTNKVVESS
ncbi:hypothetical protein RJ639_019519 [Escallonia herrerae]|uniref:Uncharacterized protein n=1 Tax=Escallonia herrerae TaxID=1293975 RepID=A0AA88V7S6_9ASTE|nr:hypothetical protein RJ639_019519 [Escallonia herrerae]